MGTKDRRAGVWCAIGIMMGSTIWIVASLMGLSTIFMAQPVLMRLVQIIGGCYIAWIGFTSLKSGFQGIRDLKHGPSPDMIVNSLQQDNETLRPFHALKTGMATNLSNPKALVFFCISICTVPSSGYERCLDYFYCRFSHHDWPVLVY
ncbi:LysE family translocator [Corynebacterium ulcerans]|uniref:LysE family translocator n=1 Tax=Corynebacterium ulcerans TaxID=65058 RepID=UPI001F1F3125|nr:LysE family translocator [Corynebacterium ulcerans]